METIKIIERISKKGNKYLQTALHVEGQADSEWIPVFLKKGLEKFEFVSCEHKLDKRGVAYTLYELNSKNVFFPPVADGDTKRAIITK